MAKYDAAGDKIQRRFPTFSVILIIIGAVLLTVGIILCRTTGVQFSVETFDVNETVSGDSITDIDIDFSVGTLNLEQSADENIYINGTRLPKGFYYTAESGKLKIGIKRQKWDISQLMSFGSDVESKLTVSLPEKVYSQVIIDMGTGELKANGISCKNAELDLGVGDSCFEKLIVENFANFDCGVGDVEVKASVLGGLDADCGVGSFSFDGTINGNIDVDCGVGDCTIILTNAESEYNFVGDYSGKYGSSDGIYTADIDSGIGIIKFSFGK